MKVGEMITEAQRSDVVGPGARIAVHHFGWLGHPDQPHFVEAGDLCFISHHKRAAVDAGAQAASANGELISAHVIPRPEREVIETFLK